MFTTMIVIGSRNYRTNKIITKYLETLHRSLYNQRCQVSVIRVRAIRNLLTIRVAALTHPSKHARAVMYKLIIIM